MAGFWTLPSPDDLPEAAIGACLGEFRHCITRHRYTLTVYSARLSRGGNSGRSRARRAPRPGAVGGETGNRPSFNGSSRRGSPQSHSARLGGRG